MPPGSSAYPDAFNQCFGSKPQDTIKYKTRCPYPRTAKSLCQHTLLAMKRLPFLEVEMLVPLAFPAYDIAVPLLIISPSATSHGTSCTRS